MRNDRGYYVEPWLVFDANHVKQQLIKRPAEFEEEIEDLRKVTGEAMNYKWANTHYHMWTPYRRHLVAFAMHNNKDGISFNVWTTNSEAIGSCYQAKGISQEEWKERVKEVFGRVRLLDEGKAHCSDCGEIMVLHESGGRYFAGIYCQSCWDREWKAVEARESYN